MKVKQVVNTKFYSCYTGWNSLQFTDEAGNEVEIQMTDDNYLALADTVNNKANRIRKERAEEAAKLAKENSEDE
jgi:hypothetical protein